MCLEDLCEVIMCNFQQGDLLLLVPLAYIPGTLRGAIPWALVGLDNFDVLPWPADLSPMPRLLVVQGMVEILSYCFKELHV